MVARSKGQPVSGFFLGQRGQCAQHGLQLLFATGIDQKPQRRHCNLAVIRAVAQCPAKVLPGLVHFGLVLIELTAQHQELNVSLQQHQVRRGDLFENPGLSRHLTRLGVDAQRQHQIVGIAITAVGLQRQIRPLFGVALTHQVNQPRPVARRGLGSARKILIGFFCACGFLQLPRDVAQQAPKLLSIRTHLRAHGLHQRVGLAHAVTPDQGHHGMQSGIHGEGLKFGAFGVQAHTPFVIARVDGHLRRLLQKYGRSSAAVLLLEDH